MGRQVVGWGGVFLAALAPPHRPAGAMQARALISQLPPHPLLLLLLTGWSFEGENYFRHATGHLCLGSFINHQEKRRKKWLLSRIPVSGATFDYSVISLLHTTNGQRPLFVQEQTNKPRETQRRVLLTSVSPSPESVLRRLKFQKAEKTRQIVLVHARAYMTIISAQVTLSMLARLL